MAFIVEDGTGLEDATSYVSVQEFRDYHDDRGNDYSSSCKDTDLQKHLIRATDYIETRWRERFRGRRMSSEQSLSFPRLWLYDDEGFIVEGVPERLKRATHEYALRSLGGDLLPDPTTDASGLRLRKTREKIGPIETEIEYQQEYREDLRPYPAADRLICTYVGPAGLVYRA